MQAKKIKDNQQRTFHVSTYEEMEKAFNPNNNNKVVELKNVTVSFGRGKNKIIAVKNVTLDIFQGEVIGLVGESGSGKSTTGNAIIGLVDRESGTLKVKDFELPKKSRRIRGEIKRKSIKATQMIFQDPASSLNPYKKIKKIITEGLVNFNPKQVFAKSYDTVTASSLQKIFKNTKQPDHIAKLNINQIHELIAQNKFDEVKEVLYDKSIADLGNSQSKTWSLAKTFLISRLQTRAAFLNENKNDKEVIDKLVEDAIDSVGIPDSMLSRYPLELSGGQQQRIGISRAIILKPELLVADEPISALDVSIQAQVVNIFNDLKEKLDLTILFIAHDLRMSEYISNRIVVMYKGEILEMGDPSEIINHPIHPYTKSLIDSIPTIDKINKSLRSKRFDPTKAGDNTKAKWFNIAKSQDKPHFIFGEEYKVKEWLGVK